MGVTCVIGLQWGDEGKGKVVDGLCCEADIAVRCQGGANAGHTVVVGDRTSVLHLIPSGILREDVRCMIGNGVVLDLDLLADEIESLEDTGLRVAGRLMLSNRAHVVLPIHRRIEAATEEILGDDRIGTTMRGIGPAYRDKYGRFGIRVGDILSTDRLASRLALLARVNPIAGNAPELVDEMIDYCSRRLDLVREIAGDVEVQLAASIARDERIMLEGSQGFLLDVDFGTYPYVTSSNTGVHGLVAGAGIPVSSVDRVVGVVKAYMTRVGSGPFPTEMEEPHQSLARDAGKEYGATTGRPRRCGWMDLVALRYASSLNGVTSIAVTKLDTLSRLDRIRVCREYECAGSRVDAFPARHEVLEKCVPVYSAMEPLGNLEGVGRLADLPQAATSYVDMLLKASGADLELVSVGPSRDAVLSARH
ncbi:MAG: adenylosuccinate synthase [bacterium]